MIVTTAPSRLMDTYNRWPVEFVRGDGATLYDSDGRPYTDLVAGIAVASVGHAHPAVSTAVAEQASRLIHVSNLYGSAPQRLLADRLAALTDGMSTFFCNSGAEAVECALKLARKWAGSARTGVIAATGGFHGRTFGALSATGQPDKAAPFAPLVPGFTHVPFGDATSLEAAITAETAAVLLEPVQGEAGVVVPGDGYLAEVRAMCDRAGVLFIVDEVQTGVARTGRWFGFEHSDIEPDIVCLAKGLGGGLPIGACLARPDVAAAFQPGDHGSTFGGGPVQCAAALAVLDVIENEHLVERAADIGTELRRGLESIFPAAHVRGRGALLGVTLPVPLARRVAEGCFRRGLLVNDPAPHILRLTPPLVITAGQIGLALGTLQEVWDEVRKT